MWERLPAAIYPSFNLVYRGWKPLPRLINYTGAGKINYGKNTRDCRTWNL
jgi:hypothetical protein